MGFLEDTFTDTDSTALQDHTPDVGGAWEKMAWGVGGDTTNDGVITDNKYVPTNDPAASYRNAQAPGGNEYDIECNVYNTVTTLRFFVALHARMTPTGTADADVDRYTVLMYRRLDEVTLSKSISGSDTELDSSTWASASDLPVKFEVRDAAKKFYRDGVETLSSADDDITQDGRAGVGGSNGGSANNSIDSLVATLSGGAPAAAPVRRGLMTMGVGR